ncbi:hypothetical protein [Crenothrix sp.]|uniref:hypothetical protein n=1 Tax=Crenothrix sp. TaxID=3100433 RepID=UPI00374C9601
MKASILGICSVIFGVGKQLKKMLGNCKKINWTSFSALITICNPLLTLTGFYREIAAKVFRINQDG